LQSYSTIGGRIEVVVLTTPTFNVACGTLSGRCAARDATDDLRELSVPEDYPVVTNVV